jgi:polyisoprenoid-binding protein YceI
MSGPAALDRLSRRHIQEPTMRAASACAVALTLLTLAACSRPAEKPAATSAAPAEAAKAQPVTAQPGDYVLDPEHTSVNFRISHLGLSMYTARFTKVDGKLHFDPANPTAQTVEATIDAGSLQTNYTQPAKLDFDTQIERDFLHAREHPQITFKSTKVEMTGDRSARVTGDLTLNGATKPVVLETTFNGGYAPMAMDPGGRIGFSGKGAFKRSDFGITSGLPAPGTTMGVGDQIEVTIETEFSQPVAKNPPVAAK